MNEIDVSDIRTSDVGDLLGKFKAWQIVYFSSIVYVYGVSSFSSLGVIFLAPTINYTCSVDGNVSGDSGVEVAADECSFTANGSRFECTRWVYNRTFYRRTFTEEYNLICNREYLISLANSLQHVGDIVGSVLLGHLADRYGRRRVILSAMWCGVAASLLSQFAPSFEFILLAKVFYGFSGIGLASVGFVLLMEISGIEYRGMLGIAVELGWVTCYVAIPGISWLVRDSQYLQAVFTGAFCLLILLVFTVPESPRWLLLKNRPAEAAKVMNKALKMNRMPIVNMDEVIQKLSSVIQLTDGANKPTSVIDLFKTPSLRRRTFILYLYWFVNGLVYYGISQNAEIFGSNYYLNFFLFGVVEYPAYIIFSLVLRRSGRKWPAGLTMGLAGVFCIGAGVTPNNYHSLLVTLTVLGKFCIASSFALAYPYTSEAFPTAVRGIGLGSCSTCARISATVAPFAKELGQIIGLPWVMAIFGSCGILSGSLVYFLPETNGKVLADTLLQGEKMDRNEIS